jgi:putative restriction endonuclease
VAGTLDVGEHEGDDLPGICGRRFREDSAAEAAEAEALRILLASSRRSSAQEYVPQGPVFVLCGAPRHSCAVAAAERDDFLRVSCFNALDHLRSRFGDELPLRGGLAGGFTFDGRRVPFLNRQKGIFRAARQHGPAALSVLTSSRSPYGADEESENGWWYAYRAGEGGESDNRSLRAALELQVPLVYFRSFLPGWYTALYPVYIEEDDPHARRVHLNVGAMRFGEPTPIAGIERAYAVRETRVRLHQGRFRAVVLPAYADQCAICRLKQRRLLDAAHIRADASVDATASVTNGLSLCTIHHRAYDQDLVGVDADYKVHVARRLLEEEDGPMLDLLKTFHGDHLVLPRREPARPDRELLAERFERFAAA